MQTFTRVSPILNVKVRNRIIGTTAEHPFYARGKGWITASELQFGDRLLTSEGEWIGCEGIEDTGRVETVYNFEVEDSHTYFVGEKDWGFDVWVHNYTAGGRLTQGLFSKEGKRNQVNLFAKNGISKGKVSQARSTFLGDGFVKVSAGKWRSLDGKRQFRLKPEDYLGGHGNQGGHLHFEYLQQALSGKLNVIKNIHVPLV